MTMIDDSRGIADGETLRAPVCIVGGGAAGLVIANDLARAGVPSILLEAGDAKPTRKSQSAYWAGRSGADTHSLAYSRFRTLGGSTAFWTGQCVELDEADFLGRRDAPAWPFEKHAIAPFYEEAAERLQLCPPGAVGANLRPPDSLGTGAAGFLEVRLSPIGNFAEAFARASEGKARPRIILNAMVTELRLADDHGRVTSVSVILAGNRKIHCQADIFVLASGGIENARLLLLSDRQIAGGIGNGHDLVGRYFMDHAYMLAGTIRDAPAEIAALAVADLADQRVRSGGFLALASERRTADASPCNAAALFLSAQPGFALSSHMTTAQGKALTHLAQMSRGERFFGRDTWPRLASLAARPDRAVALTAHRIALGLRRSSALAVRLFAETTPRFGSRIRLIARRDAFGLRRAHVHWEIMEEDKQGPACLLAKLDTALAACGARRITAEKLAPGHPWPASFTGGKHHMGTTRMDASPRRGVVDAECRVHGIENLYVAGSSVFPTSGRANPTLTIVALALRLSRRVMGALPSGSGSR